MRPRRRDEIEPRPWFRRRIFVKPQHGYYGRFHRPRWSPRRYPAYRADDGEPRYWDSTMKGIPFRPLRLRGPRWRVAWGHRTFRIAHRHAWSQVLRRLRVGTYATSPAIALELLERCKTFHALTAHEQAAAIRDVVAHYGLGRER